MPTKNPIKNREYVAKSRQKAIYTLGIDEYRRIQARKQKEYRAKKKAVQNPHIQDRKLRSIDINEMLKVRQELKMKEEKNKILS